MHPAACLVWHLLPQFTMPLVWFDILSSYFFSVPLFSKMRFTYHCLLQSMIFHAMTSDLRFWSHRAKFCTAPYPGANQMAAYRTHDYISVESCFDVSPSCLMDLYSNSILTNKNVATSHMTTVIFEPSCSTSRLVKSNLLYLRIEQCSINIFLKKVTNLLYLQT